jgi:Cation transporting ATPase, C-terminus
MCANIIGHSIYQISILSWVLFKPETLPIDPPVAFEPFQGSLNWSLFFNVFVMLQLFNELNARRLPTAEKLRTTLSEWNTFQGISTNPNFVVIMVATFSLQILLMEYGGEAVHVVPGGITTSQWAFCVGAGAGSLVWQLFINTAVALFAPTQDDEMKKTKVTSTVDKIEEEAVDAAAAAAQVPVVPASTSGSSRWDVLRKEVQRDILYSKVLGASVRRGHKLNTLIRKGTNISTSQRRSDVYYKMLGKQLHHSKKKQE